MEKQGITDLKYELAKALTELFVFASGIGTWSTAENTSPEQEECITELV